MISDNAVKKEKKVSISSSDDSDLQPVAYSFKGPKDGPTSGSVVSALQPPYWLYHDHALGVIWMLFHKDKNYIGISQLHWCLRFLLDLKNSEGEYTGDVDICIRAIQDDLIEQYSKLGTILEKSVEEKSSQRKKLSRVPVEAIGTILDAERAEETVENFTRDSAGNESLIIKREDESTVPSELDPIDESNNNRDGMITDHSSSLHSRDIKGTSTPKEDEPRASILGERRNERGSASGERCGRRCGHSDRRTEKEEIVGITYKEMIARGATPCIIEYSIEDTYDYNRYMDQSTYKTDNENIRKEELIGRALTDKSTSELANFFNSSRKQHVDVIKKEIERLYGLEKFMEHITTNDFSAYVTEDLARRVENFRDEDVVKVAGEILK